MEIGIIGQGKTLLTWEHYMAWCRVSCYIKKMGYTWTYEHLKHDYQEYYMKGFYISHTCKDVIEKNKEDCKILFE